MSERDEEFKERAAAYVEASKDLNRACYDHQQAAQRVDAARMAVQKLEVRLAEFVGSNIPRKVCVVDRTAVTVAYRQAVGQTRAGITVTLDDIA